MIGGSVGGLFAAHLLRAAGWDVAVFERAAGDLGDRGTGIGTREELFAVMRRIGLAADASLGIDVEGRVGLDRDGGVIHELPVPAVTSAWSRIWRPLRQALPDACYTGGKTLRRIEPQADGVTAVFDDGSRAEGDLLVAADGLHSTVRAQFLPGLAPRYAGYVAWRGVVEAAELSPDASRSDVPPDGVRLSGRRTDAVDPDAGAARRRRARLPFRLVPPVTESALADLCTDASGRRHGVSIPPPLIRPELIAALKRDADALLAPQLAALVQSHGADHPAADLRS